MKKIAFLTLALLVSLVTLSAQNYMVVDSKKIFESLEEYTQALQSLDNMGKSYQSEVEEKFNNVEKLYNSYMQRQGALNATERAVYEAKIAELESEATEYQESIFAGDGVLMKRRLELLSPIQSRVFNAIESYAKSNNFDLVLDEATNTTILYKSSKVERTNEIIEQLKK